MEVWKLERVEQDLCERDLAAGLVNFDLYTPVIKKIDRDLLTVKKEASTKDGKSNMAYL